MRNRVTITIFAAICLLIAVLPASAQTGNIVQGVAWEDANGNGIQDDADVMNDIRVMLTDTANNTIAETTTDANGFYQFTDVPAGTYRVQFSSINGYTFSPGNIDNNQNDDVDSDVNLDTGQTPSFEVTVSGSATGTTQTVQPTITNAYLTNPGIGWQDQPGGVPSLLPETVAYAIRSSISWRKIHVAPDTYDWSPIDQWLNEAKAEGKQLSFRVYTMRGEGFGGHQMPQWVLDRGATLAGDAPDYGSCVYQEEWGRFVEALRLRYDGNPDIAYVDISGYGNFNEWSWVSQTRWENDWRNPQTTDGYARKRLADTFMGGSSSQHVCENTNGGTRTVSYSYPGWSQTQLIMPYAGIRHTVYYAVSKRADVGFRFDCLGNAGAYSDIRRMIGPELSQIWKTAPVAYEMCGGGLNWGEAEDLLRFSHGSLVHDNATSGRSNVENLLRYAGYRYVLDEAQFADAASPGGSLPVSMTWRNVGYAPNYPRMGQTFELRTYLVDNSGNVAAQGTSSANIASWFPAEDLDNDSPPRYDENVTMSLPAGLPTGNYSLQVAIMDTRTGKPINLGINGRNNAGRYPLGTVQISGGISGGSTYNWDAGYVPNTSDAEVIVQPSQLDVAEGENSTEYTITLGSAPQSSVTIAAGAPDDINITPNLVTFSSSDWNTPQTLTVTAADDTNPEDTETVTISHVVTSQDTGYNSLAIDPISVTIADNDNPLNLTANQPTITALEGVNALNSGSIGGANSTTAAMTASVGSVANNGDGTWEWRYTGTDDLPPTTVTIRADNGTDTANTTFEFAVMNVAPSADLRVSTNTALVGQAITAQLTSVVEPGTQDTITYTIDCEGDGTFELTELHNSPTDVTTNCTYNTSGVYTVRGRVADDDGGANEYAETVTITEREQPTNTPVPPTATPQQPPADDMSIAALFLVDSETNTEITPLRDGMVFSKNDPTMPQMYSVRAAVSGDVGSVIFSGVHNQTENLLPYALFGDYDGDYGGRPFEPGTYTVNAVPYAKRGGGGAAGKSMTVTFTVESGEAPPTSTPIPTQVADAPTATQPPTNTPVPPTATSVPPTNTPVPPTATPQQPPTTEMSIAALVLVNSETNTEITPLRDGMVFSKNDPLTPQMYSVRAAVRGNVKSVVFGGVNSRTENLLPYALFGDYDGDYGGRPFEPGTYTVNAVPYAEKEGNGTAGTPMTVTFTVVSGDAPPTNTPIPSNTPQSDDTAIPPTSPPDQPDVTAPPSEEAPDQPTVTQPPTNTPVPPTATSVPPTNTPVPPTATPVPPTNTPQPEPADLRITKLVLVDSESNKDIATLSDGMVFQADEAEMYSVRAETNDAVGSVLFSGVYEQTENLKPYALFGDYDGDYGGRPFKPGTYTVRAVPYAEKDGGGASGDAVEITFTVE